MSTEDFDLAGLAAYLHLDPAKVQKMAERGTIPGRKIGGQWKFSRPEVHHWLEERIGVSDEDGLVRVEEVLQRDAPAADNDPVIHELIPVEAIAIPLDARTRGKVITAMCQQAMATGLLWDPDKMAEAVRAREDLHPTALDNGVALLHPRRPQAGILAQAVVALGRTFQGIPFGGTTLTDLFFLICSTSDSEHLRILARVSRLISDPKLLDQLREADSPEAARQLIAEAEAEL